MNGKQGAWLLIAVMVVALLWQLERGVRLWRADRVIGSVTRISASLVEQNRSSATVVARNIDLLHAAERLDPASVSVPLLLGAQYLLRGRAEPALEALERARTLEPRAEVFRNLGEAYRLLGDDAEAKKSFSIARWLDPTVVDENVRGFLRAQKILEDQPAELDDDVILVLDFESGSVPRGTKMIERKRLGRRGQ